MIVEKKQNNGQFLWYIPEDFETASNYRIRVHSFMDSTITDYSDSTFAILDPTPVSRQGELPHRTTLFPNYPNPFNPSTTIQYALFESVPVSLMVMDAVGRQVITLVDRVQDQGMHSIQWDGKDSQGRMVASGIYMLLMKAGSYRQYQKMIILH